MPSNQLILSPEEEWNRLKAYLVAKLFVRDWHGVRDAAVDLEVLEAKHPELREQTK